MNPVNSLSDIGYHSTDFGESWIATSGVPWGRIYPTPDSLGTLIVQPSNTGAKFFVRYDVTQPYEELAVTPEDLPAVDWLFYNSVGQMIIGNQSGHFHIADGITSAVEEERAEQMGALRVWPNPASKEITVQHQTQRIIRVSIYDLMGRNVRTISMEPSQEITLDVTELEAGIYFVEVMDERGGRSVQQLVVEGGN